jgi:hypothetical protein
MATEANLRTMTRVAASDLSAKQYYGVKIDSNGKIALAGEGDIAVGILQDKPEADAAGCVAIGGESKVVAGGSVTAGTRFTFDSTGKAVAVGSGDDHAMGIALETLASGKIGTVLIQPVGTTL